MADLSGYVYLPTWPSEIPFTGELIRWCDLNGIWAADVEDTLLEIAIRFDVEMEEITRLNGIIGDENLIVEGEELLIPVATGDRP